MKNILICMALFLLYSCSLAGIERAKHEQPLNVPEGMVLVPAGYFYMGTDPKDGRLKSGIDFDADELPKHRVFVKGFYIDKFEVTNSEYKKYLKRSGSTRPLPEYFFKKKKYSRKEDSPITDIGWFAARDYCRYIGKRLPAEAEWEKAARGADGRLFPWGNEKRVDWFNNIDNGPGMPVKGGSFPHDLSPYGVFDMAGNVSEWTDTWYDAYPGSKAQDMKFGRKYAVIRGASFATPIEMARTSARGYHLKTTHLPTVFAWAGNTYIGFRCVMDVY